MFFKANRFLNVFFLSSWKEFESSKAEDSPKGACFSLSPPLLSLSAPTSLEDLAIGPKGLFQINV